ncbi:hypothetical protein LCI18_011256 [Fusarium solani-melongenae]|uniref:Uncharacterized protein n=1 Tax=Fusarium solani subsp. cucurbitae TaxID=2747967 RepID=A0ACD3ZGS1_FUSSC|nr:hypothetical protein LCI18_011256 [Fusarium solani-melongenae]
MAVLSSALRFSNDGYYKDSTQEAIESYAKESWVSILKDHMTNDNYPDIHVIQAASILAIIDFTAGRTSSGWLKIGLAVRISQDLQLMQEPDNSLLPAEQEERRRVFWSVFLLDRLVSCGHARPLAIQEEDCHVQLPCDEETFQAGVWKKTATLKQVLTWKTGDQVEGLCSNFALVILAATALGRCAKHVLQDREMDNIRPYDHKPLPLDPDCLLMLVDHHLQMQGPSLDTALAQYRKLDGMLDDQVVGHIVFARVVFHLCHCLLNHPLLIRLRLQRIKVRISPGVFARALQTSCDHACELVALLDNEALASPHTRPSFYVYSICVSGSILAMVIHAKQSRGEACDPCLVQGSHQALRALEEFGRFWDHAVRMRDRILWLDSYAQSFATLLDPTTDYNPDPATASTMRVMVDYGAMCSSTRVADGIKETPTPNTSRMLSMLDFDMGFDHLGENYGTLSEDNFSLLAARGQPGDRLDSP